MPTETTTLLKISRSDGPAGDPTTLRLEGRLVAPFVAELARACEPFHGRPGTLRLDLTGLVWADEAGVRELRRLVRAHADVAGASPFVSELLREARP